MDATGLLAGGYATVSTKVQVYEGSGADIFARINTDCQKMERDKDMTAVTVHEVLDSTLEAVAHVETVAAEVARRVGFRGVSLDHISLATHETTTNAVVHGNRYRSEKKVVVAISITQDRFKITIADDGDGFDPDTLPDPLAPERLSSGSGRGVYLSRAFMDEYHVRCRHAGGTEVTLVKYLRPR